MKKSSLLLKCAPNGNLSKEYLYKLCSSGDGMYSVPHLNDILYLHHKGIRQIDNLDEYVNVKCIYLQNNVIGRIENLSNLKSLTLLFLNENCITKIENLEGLEKLDKIDLSRNSIKIVENLSHLSLLTSLDLSYNNLTHSDDIAHLGECPSITLLRLSHNKLADPDTIQVLSKMSKMRALFLDGNPLLGVISPYRKKVILAFPELCYLDDRPVKPEERELAKAWLNGGEDAEDLLKLEWKLHKEREIRELHLKTYERMKQRYPELYKETCLKEVDDNDEDDLGQNEMDDICPIRMPWHTQRSAVMNDHARRLVEEIEAEPEIPELEEVFEKLEASNCGGVEEVENESGDAILPEKPLCIQEYIRILEREKIDKLAAENEAASDPPAETGMKSLPEELHFPLSQRIEIWEDFMSGNYSGEDEAEHTAEVTAGNSSAQDILSAEESNEIQSTE